MSKSIENFWANVLESLVSEHKFSQADAQQLVSEHRHLVTGDGVGYALMNFGPEDMAEGIALARKSESDGR